MRDAVQEIRCAVERIDDPAVAWVAARDLAAFLEQEAIAGARALQLVFQGALGLQIRGRDELAGPLYRDLKLLDLAEVAHQAARRLQRGVRHDIDDRGAYRQTLNSKPGFLNRGRLPRQCPRGRACPGHPRLEIPRNYRQRRGCPARGRARGIWCS